MANDPATGPIPRERFKELSSAPCGEAKNVIREYDPLWGRAPGEKIDWLVRVARSGRDTGTAYVTAATEEEAEALAEKIHESDIDWDYDDTDFEVTSVDAAPPRRRTIASPQGDLVVGLSTDAAVQEKV